MKKILSVDIFNFLNEASIRYECNVPLREEYIIASLFMPVKQGFYFLVGNELPQAIADSVILLHHSNRNPLTNNNIGIYLFDSSPQQVFYRLLSSLYKTQSTGVIASTAVIHPEAIIGKNVQIDHFVVIDRAIIEDHVIIRSHSYIHSNSVIRNECVIENHSVIGAQGVAWIWDEQGCEKIVQPQLGGVDVGPNCFLGAGTILVRGSLNENTKIGKSTFLAPGCRIGHGTQIGEYVHFANNITTGGNTKIGDYCFVGSAAVFRPRINIHSHTIVGAGAVVVKHTTTSGKTLMGVPAVEVVSKAHSSGMPQLKFKKQE